MTKNTNQSPVSATSRWMLDDSRILYTVLVGFAFLAMTMFLIYKALNDGPEKVEKSIIIGISQVEPKCQELASSVLITSIINKGEALEEDEVEESLDEYKDIKSEDCELMIHRLSAGTFREI